MQSVSSTYKRLIERTNRKFESRLIIDDVGTFPEDQLMSISTNVALFSGAPEIGKAVSQEINVSMLMPSATIPRMACVRPQVRLTGTVPKSSAVAITDGGSLSSSFASYANEKITFSEGANARVVGETLAFPVDSTETLFSEWLDQGVFFIDTRDVTANDDGLEILSFHGFDAMMKAEVEYKSDNVVDDAPDTAYVQEIANAIGVNVDPRTWDIMRGYVIPFPIGYTMREILGFIAASYVGYFIITESGELRLISILGMPERIVDTLLGDEDGDAILFGGIGIVV